MFSSGGLHTSCALGTGVQTSALPIPPAERPIGQASKCAMHADHVRSHELERLRGVAGICVELSESAVDIEAVGEDDEFLHRIFTALPPPVHEFRSDRTSVV